MTQATRWLPGGAYEETRDAPTTAWVPVPALGAGAVTETQTTSAAFIARQGLTIQQAVNRASTY